MARPLALPPKDLNIQALCIEQLNPSRLCRISRHLTGEPYFGRSGGNRFSQPGRIERIENAITAPPASHSPDRAKAPWTFRRDD